MYLWKYWRESRIVICIGVLVLAAIASLSVFGHGNSIENPRAYASVVYVLLFAVTAPLALFAWGMGSFGTGRSLGEGAGAYLLTRPRRRSFFVWRDWGTGISTVALFIVVTYALAGTGLYRGLELGGAEPGKMLFHNGPDYLSLAASLGLDAASCLLFCGLVFGLVYLLTIVMKSALGIVVGGGVLAGYVILSALLDHYTGHKLPDLLQTPFVPSHDGAMHFSNLLAVSMAVRAGIVLLFPVAAQLVLERSDI